MCQLSFFLVFAFSKKYFRTIRNLDLAGEIFYYAVETADLSDEIIVTPRIAKTMRIASVNKLWRTLTFHLPSLWSNISFSYYRTREQCSGGYNREKVWAEREYEILTNCLQRSGNRPLTLDLRYPHNFFHHLPVSANIIHPILNIILGAKSRWEKVTLSVHSDVISNFIQKHIPLSEIETLHINDASETTRLSHIPSTKYLSLWWEFNNGFPFRSVSQRHITSVTTLSIKQLDSMSIRQFINLFPSITTLVIELCDHRSWDDEPHNFHTTLLSLTDLHIIFSSTESHSLNYAIHPPSFMLIFDNLRLPALHYVELQIQPKDQFRYNDFTFWPYFDDMLRISNYPLRDLVICHHLSNEFLLGAKFLLCLTSLRNLEVLQLDGEFLSAQIVEILTTPITENPPSPPCPLLRVLGLYHTKPNMQLVRELMNVRWRQHWGLRTLYIHQKEDQDLQDMPQGLIIENAVCMGKINGKLLEDGEF